MREGEGRYFEPVMGAVQILPTLTRHNHGGDFTRNDERSLIQARQFVFAQSGKLVRPEDVLKRLVLNQHPKTVCVVIVHMQSPPGGQADQRGWRRQIDRQIPIIREAKKLGLDIFQALRAPDPTRFATVPRLQGEIGQYTATMVFADLRGNALEAASTNPAASATITLREMLRIRKVGAAIVMGQEIHACVRDTIFGQYYQDLQTGDRHYSGGILDSGVSVLTSREILAPAEDGLTRSTLYEFELETELVEALGPSPALQRSALAAATFACTRATDSAAS